MRDHKRGFSLIELMAVMGIIAMLGSMLIVAVTAVKRRGDMGRCANNLRQLVTANQLYAAEHGSYVPAAQDMMSQNKQRWHGARTRQSEPFDAAQGPLAPYLGNNRAIRHCPSFTDYEKGFEASCGGYGYNVRGVGSRTYKYGMTRKGVQLGMTPGMIQDATHTVMFADAAMGQPYHNPKKLIEYSFAEAPKFVAPGGREYGKAFPSVHFRHGGVAMVAWCDGRVTAEKPLNTNEASNKNMILGWFQYDDNRLWDPY